MTIPSFSFRPLLDDFSFCLSAMGNHRGHDMIVLTDWIILATRHRGFESALQGNKDRCRETGKGPLTAEKRDVDMGDGSSDGEKWSAPRTPPG